MRTRWLLSLVAAATMAVGIDQVQSAGRSGSVAALAGDVLAAAQAPTDPLPSSCDPFGALSTNDRPVDNSCGLQGTPGATSGQQAQNRVKNNFCAHQNATPATITRYTFDRLQARTPSKATLPWGSRDSIPATDSARNALHDLYTTTYGDTVGEGSYVQFVGYILEGHFGGAESVNCDLNRRQSVDIHLALVTVRPSTLDLTNYDTECTSVTAEISSHHRPIDWDILGRMTKPGAGRKLTGAQEKLADEDLRRPIRIRGQLMFDASHRLCANGHRTTGNPARRSGWEIHPVYSIDVCESATTLASCQIDGRRWKPLNEFLNAGEDT